jgi:hypothetical protein
MVLTTVMPVEQSNHKTKLGCMLQFQAEPLFEFEVAHFSSETSLFYLFINHSAKKDVYVYVCVCVCVCIVA